MALTFFLQTIYLLKIQIFDLGNIEWDHRPIKKWTDNRERDRSPGDNIFRKI